MGNRAKTGKAKISKAGAAAKGTSTSKRAARQTGPRAAKSRPTRRKAKAARRPAAGPGARVRGLFSHLRVTPSTSGGAAFVAVATADGGKLKVAASRIDQIQQPAGANRKKASKGLAADQRKRLAQIIDAVASSHRLGILLKLLEGPATYKALQRTTGLKVGPLYHHVNRLRGEGLIGPRERDLYLLTVAGRNLALALMAALPLVSGRRPAG